MPISQCESKGCHQVFTSISTFEMHRTDTYGEPIYTRKGRFKGYTTPTPPLSLSSRDACKGNDSK